jgi:hypothetical protein
MTRVFDNARADGGTRLLVLGASAYPHAQTAKLRVPKLSAISSAATSALKFAYQAIDRWENQFPKSLTSVDLLVDTPEARNGATFTDPSGHAFKLEAATMKNVKDARKAWMLRASADDVLVFYCCGHGIWLPATGRTFLTASFGADEDNPWPDTVALDDFAFALGEHAPRQQWLIFDCCNNTPTEALKAMGARADPLLAITEGQRMAAETAYGLLSQVTVSSSSPGAQSFGKDGRPSRFMEAFLEACEGSGCRRHIDGKWWVDQQGIEEAIATYRVRVAPVEEEDYFTFPRVTQTDAADVPRFLGRDEKPKCTLLVRSKPPHRLKQAALTIRCRSTTEIVGSQQAGPAALARYRLSVNPWLDYDLEATFDTGPIARESFAIPPLAETMF